MTNLTLLIIRHAKKPGEGFGPGLTIMGRENENSLAIRGWQRAGAWAALFGFPADPAYPSADFVYACNPDKEPEGGESITRRPYETSVPLCKKMGIAPVITYGVGEEKALIAELTRLMGTVVIFWEHKKIGETILPHLAAGQKIPEMPEQWHPDRFDVVLRFDREKPRAPWHFRQLFPRLLEGDSEKLL